MAKISKLTWAKRVERWIDSGLSAKEFAAELDVSPVVLARWRRKLEQLEAAGRLRDVERAQRRPTMRSASQGPEHTARYPEIHLR